MTFTHSFHPSVLREYDVRGVVGDTLSVADAFAVGRCFGSVVTRAGGRRVAVGCDGRLSSPELEPALVGGLMASGMTVLRIGCGPTPMLYYTSVKEASDGAVMVTGSHNPPDHNGFKMMLRGKPFYGEAIRALGRMAAAGDVVAEAVGCERPLAMGEAYVARLIEGWDGGDRGLSVVWDNGNGAAGGILATLLDRLPGKHVLLNGTIDGDFPAHHPDPTVPKNLEQLVAEVRARGADLGVAFDGDADRIGIVDDTGSILFGDQLMVLFARDVLGRIPGATIIADVKASQVLFDEIARLGGRPLMWRTGHSLIKAKMAETGAPLAGEMSGHIFFAERWYGFDDALYAAIRLLGVLGRYGCRLSELRQALPQAVNTPELRFPVPEERKFAIVDEVASRLRVRRTTFTDIDGVRVRTPDGWWLLRASNTQAVLVARVEAKDDAGLERLKAVLIAELGASAVGTPNFVAAESGH
ncbi:MAG TPA: phosphomannomutase/phosphoglucomutase [Acetobacteraceae bacterium]|jgi:phosphomannomutase|nr:phosphomannomutase/phosphoglucomutase [Acetobacteraceae bacterium]